MARPTAALCLLALLAAAAPLARATESESWVKEQCSRVRSACGGCNVMIFNSDEHDYAWLERPAFKYESSDEGYSMWGFDGPAKFENKGDGGFINWCFSGAYDRIGDSVVQFY